MLVAMKDKNIVANINSLGKIKHIVSEKAECGHCHESGTEWVLGNLIFIWDGKRWHWGGAFWTGLKNCQYFYSQRPTADIAFERDGSNTGTNMRKVNPCLERIEEFWLFREQDLWREIMGNENFLLEEVLSPRLIKH